jgi:Mn-dependent DtxR family transcriptional regulator
MIVTPKQLAAELAVTDQAATGMLRQLRAAGMLRQLRAAGIAREATGRQSFRAFCLRL